MGAGAGYTIEVKNAKIVGNVQINSFELTGEDSNLMFQYDVYTVDCVVPLTGSVRAESYMYSCDWISNVPMTVRSVTINFMRYDGMPEVTEQDIMQILNNTANYIGEGVYGGGWSHATFDGEIEIRPDVDHNDYADDISEVVITIDHPNIVNYIDKAVTGDNKEYSIVFNGDPIDGYEDEDEAIKRIKEIIREEITENGFDSIDFSNCYVEELYWSEDVDGNQDIVDPWYDNIVYRADDDYDDFENFADALGQFDDDDDIGEDFEI